MKRQQNGNHNKSFDKTERGWSVKLASQSHLVVMLRDNESEEDIYSSTTQAEPALRCKRLSRWLGIPF